MIDSKDEKNLKKEVLLEDEFGSIEEFHFSEDDVDLVAFSTKVMEL